jgi:hypothetical protein
MSFVAGESQVFDSVLATSTWLCSEAKDSPEAADAATSLQGTGPSGFSYRIQRRLHQKRFLVEIGKETSYHRATN